jgi:hypothetical protein
MSKNFIFPKFRKNLDFLDFAANLLRKSTFETEKPLRIKISTQRWNKPKNQYLAEENPRIRQRNIISAANPQLIKLTHPIITIIIITSNKLVIIQSIFSFYD